MSQLDDITLLCEGVHQGEDVVLLEAARATLEGRLPIARHVTIRPAGSKLDLPSAMRALRALQQSLRVFAVRDRDFLRVDHVRTARAKALSLDTREQELRPYPLRQHCIESYLLDPPFLEEALGDDLKAAGIDLGSTLDRLAEERCWSDVCTGAIEAASRQMRDRDRPSRKADVHTREEAIQEVKAALSRYETRVHDVVSTCDVAAEVDALTADFSADGPLWTRVHGSEMLLALEQQLRVMPRFKGGNLKNRLLTHAAYGATPEPLVEEMEALLLQIQAATRDR
ncbi:MAG TPA: hypothetical protein VLS89_08875 [Candidatus Nanopelagicales bacterium]|nr:hypothetical protein [Candidatus Nanopelagicales bacterium]